MYKLLLLTLALSLTACNSCGGDDNHGEVDPGRVKFDHLQGGFWVSVDDASKDDTMQFLTAGQVRELYGGQGIEGTTTATLGSRTVDELMDYFEPDHDVMLTFRDGVRLSDVYAVQVADGSIGLSRLGEVAGNVTDGVLFTFGFAEPYDVPITAFTQKEQLSTGENEINFPRELIWREDCRWRDGPGWVNIGSLDLDSNAVPWALTYVSKSGDVVTHRYNFATTYLRAGRCPVNAAVGIASQTGHTVVPWGSDGGALLYHDETAQLRGINLAEIMNQEMVTQLPDGRIGPWRVIDDRTFAVLHRLGDGSANPPQFSRSRLTDLTAAAPWPFPELPDGVTDAKYRLLPDGRAMAQARDNRGESLRHYLAVETAGGAWEELALAGTLADGTLVDLGPHRSGVEFVVDSAHRVTAVAPAAGVLPQLHPRRPVSGDVLVRLGGGQAQLHVIPPAIHGAHFRITHETGYFDVAPDDAVHLIGEYAVASEQQSGHPTYTQLVHTRWPVDEQPSVQLLGVDRSLGDTRFVESPMWLGTPIATNRQFVLGADGSVIASDGWARTYVQAPDSARRVEQVPVSFELVNAPPGARIRSSTGPEFDCDASCEVDVPAASFLAVWIDVPAGWIADPSPSWDCTLAQLDAGYCFARAAEEQFTLTFRRTPVLEVSEVNPSGVFLEAVGGKDGRYLVKIGSPGGTLPDGTEVTGASNQNLFEAVSLWQGTQFHWLVPQHESLPFRKFRFADNGDVLVAYEATGFNGSFAAPTGDLALERGDHVVARYAAADGALLSATVFSAGAALSVDNALPLADGGFAVVAATLRAEVDDATTGLTFGANEAVLVIWSPDGEASLVRTWPGNQRGELHAVGDHVAVVLFGAQTNVVVANAAGEVVADRTFDWVRSGAIVPRDILLQSQGDELLIGTVVDGESTFDGHALPGTGLGVFVAAMNTAGEFSDVARLPVEPPQIGRGAPRALARLNDGQLMANIGWDFFGREAFLFSEDDDVVLGPSFRRDGTYLGYETHLALPQADDTLLWVARHWSEQILRPYALGPDFSMVLDLAELSALPTIESQ